MSYPLKLIIGPTTTHEMNSYLVPQSLKLYDSLDSRSALSFSLTMDASSDPRPTVGEPVYLAEDTTNEWYEWSLFHNQQMNGTATMGTTEGTTGGATGWIGGHPSYNWYCWVLGSPGHVSLDNNEISLFPSSTHTAPNIRVGQSLFGRGGSSATPPAIPGETYRVSLDFDISMSASTNPSTGGARAYVLYSSSPSTFALVGYSAIGVVGNGATTSGTWTTNVTVPTSCTYAEIYLQTFYCQGYAKFSNLKTERLMPNYVFGGTLDEYTETCYPFTSQLVLNCNAVDMSQLVGKRLVYKSYPSSGIGEYTSIASTEPLTCDGTQQVWELTYPAKTVTGMTLNALSVSYGVVGSCSTLGYYYTPSSHLILGNTSNTAPASTDTLTVVYTAEVPLAPYDSDMIEDIAHYFFYDEGIDAQTHVQRNERMPEVNFNFMPGNESINLIGNITGHSWFIDPWKRLHYFQRGGNLSPFSVTSTSNNWRNLSVRRSRNKYRNKEYVIGSYGVQRTTESLTGDGYNRTFTLGYPVLSAPTITLNGFKATVGVLGSASTHGYYWLKESRQIIANSSNTAPASTDTLKISYDGIYPFVAVADNGNEQSARAAIEGNSGIYEEFESMTKTYDAAAALKYSNSFLEKFGVLPADVTFETDEDGLAAGQLINISNTAHDIDDTYFITTVSGRDISGNPADTRLRYQITAASGNDRGGWLGFFRNIIRGINPILTAPYEALVQGFLKSNADTVSVEDFVIYSQSSFYPMVCDSTAHGIVGTDYAGG